jgi:hypothetical protein
MHGNQPQPIETVIPDPEQSAIDQKFTDDGALFAFEVDGRPPGGCVRLTKERRGVSMQIVEMRAEMVINYVETIMSRSCAAFSSRLRSSGRPYCAFGALSSTPS